ncbi:MAG: hypothetical protein IT272_13260 [Chitinophagales bacterium]|jgi:hypothetical protein|nr:hypothetical protein [Sphingobacteriales bacterium]MCC7058381.1 hypothetical protein [Chitinophagales bacterium]MDA0198976.1 hypothetical protein [Bacteroidota bacterium]
MKKLFFLMFALLISITATTYAQNNAGNTKQGDAPANTQTNTKEKSADGKQKGLEMGQTKTRSGKDGKLPPQPKTNMKPPKNRPASAADANSKSVRSELPPGKNKTAEANNSAANNKTKETETAKSAKGKKTKEEKMKAKAEKKRKKAEAKRKKKEEKARKKAEAKKNKNKQGNEKTDTTPPSRPQTEATKPYKPQNMQTPNKNSKDKAKQPAPRKPGSNSGGKNK